MYIRVYRGINGLVVITQMLQVLIAQPELYEATQGAHNWVKKYSSIM